MLTNPHQVITVNIFISLHSAVRASANLELELVGLILSKNLGHIDAKLITSHIIAVFRHVVAIYRSQLEFITTHGSHLFTCTKLPIRICSISKEQEIGGIEEIFIPLEPVKTLSINIREVIIQVSCKEKTQVIPTESTIQTV